MGLEEAKEMGKGKGREDAKKWEMGEAEKRIKERGRWILRRRRRGVGES